MSDEFKCAVYCRVGNKSQADDHTEKKLEAVRLLQEVGYIVAVAPVDFRGDAKILKQIPRLSDDPALEEGRALLRGDQALVIIGLQR